MEGLRNLGHDVRGGVNGFDRTLFGRGHIIQKIEADVAIADETSDVDRKGFYLIGCETRSDGIPCGY